MIVLVGIVSLIGIFYVSRKISGPISRLSKEVDNSRLVKEIPELHATGIQEIDQFSSAITALRSFGNVDKILKYYEYGKY